MVHGPRRATPSSPRRVSTSVGTKGSPGPHSSGCCDEPHDRGVALGEGPLVGAGRGRRPTRPDATRGGRRESGRGERRATTGRRGGRCARRGLLDGACSGRSVLVTIAAGHRPTRVIRGAREALITRASPRDGDRLGRAAGTADRDDAEHRTPGRTTDAPADRHRQPWGGRDAAHPRRARPQRPGRARGATASRPWPCTPRRSGRRCSSGRPTPPTTSAPRRCGPTSTTRCSSGRCARPGRMPRGSAGASSPRTPPSPSSASASA